MGQNNANLGRALLGECRDTFRRAQRKIEHCLDQLTDADVTWRPGPGMNSIAIIVNHLAGNARQWIVSGLGGAPDVRRRWAEFDDPGVVTVAAVRSTLRAAVDAVDRALASADPGTLLGMRAIQGFTVTGVHALVDTTAHFVGHTHQVVQITRMRRGESYAFAFVPAGAAQGARPSADGVR